jgi:hypothetical protein
VSKPDKHDITNAQEGFMTFRFNRRFYPFNAFRSLLGIGANGESPTYDGLYSGEWTHPNVSHGTHQPLEPAC